jgi:hypothetical protein
MTQNVLRRFCYADVNYQSKAYELHQERTSMELVLESTGELLSTEGKLPLLQNKGQFRIARYWAFADDEPNICLEVPISSPLGLTKTP